MTFFTSESVSEGHPDKNSRSKSLMLFLDSILSKDKNCAVACETMIKNSLIIVSGEIQTDLWVDLEKIVYEVIKNIGYDDISKGLNADNLSIINLISKQSKEIHDSVFDKSDNCIGAGGPRDNVWICVQ